MNPTANTANILIVAYFDLLRRETSNDFRPEGGRKRRDTHARIHTNLWEIFRDKGVVFRSNSQ